MRTKKRKNRRLSHSPGLRDAFTQAIMNVITGRTQLAGDLKTDSAGIDPPGRDLDYECGYPTSPSVYTYRKLYQRNEYARRANDIWADECWAVRPNLYETEEDRKTKFERAWDKLNIRLKLWHYLHRLDKVCGIGSFGVLLLGFNDGQDLSTPVRGVTRTGEFKRKSGKPLDLIYVCPYAEDSVSIAKIEDDRNNPRYGQPRWYDIKVRKATERDDGTVAYDDHDEEEEIRVHWSRVIHVADNCESGDLFGTARMEPILNRILDIRKTLGGSAEMFWKGAFPGYSFETIPELLGESTMDEDSIRDQFEEYMDGLKRYLALDGATVKPLFPQVADPTAHVVQQTSAICACIGVPLRIFMGTESGHLASTQDSVNMNKRVARRQQLFCEPFIIRPLVDRLIGLGILPEPEEYMISWTDLNTMTDKDKALVSLQRAQALMQYVDAGAESILPVEFFYTLILGLTPQETEAVMKRVKEQKAEDLHTDPLGDHVAERDTNLEIKKGKALPKPAPIGVGGLKKPKKKARTQGGGRRGNAPRQQAGRPAGRIQRNSVFSLT